MNKPQAEGNVNPCLYSWGRSSNKPFSCAAFRTKKNGNTLKGTHILYYVPYKHAYY